MTVRWVIGTITCGEAFNSRSTYTLIFCLFSLKLQGMSNSRLLQEYSDDEEFTLNPVQESVADNSRYLNSSLQRPYFQTTDSSDNEDMEAPPSLILERASPIQTSHRPSTRDHVTAYDRTMWRWANVENMDDFFNRVYEYFQGKGIYCILLARLLNLL